MKLGKLLYFIAIIGMAIISFVMIKHGWFFGYFTALITFAGVINYFDIVETNRRGTNKSYRSRRAAHFNSMTHEQQEEYLDEIERELQNALKE